MGGQGGMIEQASLVAAVEQAADGIVITTTAGKIRYVNPAFTVMTGYTSEEAVGQNPRVLKSGRHTAAFYKELWDTIRSGKVWHGEVVNRRKDGTFYTEEMRITPVHGSNGEIVSYIAIKHDVTERRAAEEVRRVSRRHCGEFRRLHCRLHSRRDHSHLESWRTSNFWLLRPRSNRAAHVHAGTA